MTPALLMSPSRWAWNPLFDAWIAAAQKSRGTEGHEPPGKSSFNANRMIQDEIHTTPAF
jgi:hypothetical protein